MIPLSPAPRPKRRYLHAALVGALVGGSILAALGFATADGDAPATLELPEPLVGDRATYSITTIRETESGLVVLEAERPHLGFEWRASVVGRDADGVPVRTNVALVTRFDEQDGGIPSAVWAFEAGSERVVSYTYLDEQWNSQTSSQLGGSWSTREHSTMSSTTYLRDDFLVTTCLLRNRLQGASVSLAEPVALFPRCEYPSHTSDEDAFDAVGRDVVAGYPTVELARAGLFGSAVRVSLSPDLAYPLRLAVEDPARPAVFHVLRLTGFSTGTEALARVDDASGPAAPPLVEAPRKPWGVDETGVGHPFPVGEAYARARDDPQYAKLRDFLAQHPDAYTALSNYFEWNASDGTGERAWTFVVATGSAHVAFSSVQARGWVHPIVGVLPLAPDQRLIATTYRVDENIEYSGPLPTPQAAPRTLPTAASMLARWAAFSGEEIPVSPSYGFTISCRDEACEDTFVYVSAGRDTGWTDDASPLSTDMRFRFSASDLTVVLPEGDTSLHTYGHEFEMSASPAPVARGSAAGDEITLASVRVEMWSMPGTPALFGAGLLGALAAIGYLVAPTVGTVGPVALYSRLTRPRALEHPARQAILEAAEAVPGIHVHELARRVHLGRTATEHHVRKLVDLGFLTLREAGGYTSVFVAGGVDAALLPASAVLRAPRARALLAAVLAHPEESAKAAAKRAALSAPTASYHLARMEAAGLVTIERAPGGARISATALAAKAQDAGMLAAS